MCVCKYDAYVMSVKTLRQIEDGVYSIGHLPISNR